MCFSRKIVALLVTLASTQAIAGGLWINEYGSPVMGRAGAGAQAGTDDASAAFFNPATMSRLEQSDFMGTLGYIVPTMEFDVDLAGEVNGFGNGGNAGEESPMGSIFYVRPINEDWTVGISGIVLAGAGIDYNAGWAGRFHDDEVSLLIGGVIPAVSYQVTERFSIGVSVPVMYGDLDMKVSVPNPEDPVNGIDGQAEIKGDDTQVGVTVGLAFELTERTRMGAMYQSKFDFEFDGDVTISPVDFEVGVDTELTMAPIVRFGLTHEFTDQLRGHATLGWDGWSDLKSVNLSTSTGGGVLPRNWHDTYHSAIGLEYDLNQRFTLQGGLAYDTSPTNKNDRTADMPMDEQIRYALGAEYRRDSGMKLAASFVYADYGDGKIFSDRNPPLVGFSGKYKDNNIIFFALSANWPLGKSRN